MRAAQKRGHAVFVALQENSDVFSDIAAMAFALAGIGRDESMRRSFIFLSSENFFSLMGVKPAIGRFYTAAECGPNANIPVVVASYPYWKKLGGRADLIGKPLTVNGQDYTLIGVTPEGFSGTNAILAPDLWLPLGASRGSARPSATPAARWTWTRRKITPSTWSRGCVLA